MEERYEDELLSLLAGKEEFESISHEAWQRETERVVNASLVEVDGLRSRIKTIEANLVHLRHSVSALQELIKGI